MVLAAGQFSRRILRVVGGLFGRARLGTDSRPGGWVDALGDWSTGYRRGCRGNLEQRSGRLVQCCLYVPGICHRLAAGTGPTIDGFEFTLTRGMTMEWMAIWKFVLVLSLSLFALLTIVTTVLGAGDIRRLFQRLEDDRKDQK